MDQVADNFSQVPDQSVDEFLRQGQECLAGTIQLAIASDQRATAMAGIYGAASIALLAAGAAIITGNIPNLPLLFSFLSTAGFLFIASLVCAWAARPIDFFVSGYEPRKLLRSTPDPNWMKRYVAEDTQQRIDANRQSLLLASKNIRVAAVFAFLAIWPLGLLVIYQLF